MLRSSYNGDLSLKDVGKEVSLVGWVSKKRNLGSLVFIDLRDRSGIIQLTVNEDVEIPDVRNEYVIQAKGKVAKKEVANKNLKTGEIEVIVSEIKDYRAKSKEQIKEDNTKVLSKSEQEKQKLLEQDEHKENE